jgi:hypothetical protein
VHSSIISAGGRLASERGLEMAFNPVKRVRERRYPTALQAHLAERLEALAALPPVTSTPYLTVSLDWRPSGSDPEYRGSMQLFEQETKRIQQEHWPRGDVFDSLGKDILRMRDWLANRVDPATKGVFIVANSGADIFEAVTLGMPLQSRIIAGPIPALMPLARLDEDNPTYAVLLADQQNAYLSLISQGHRVEELAMASSDYPRKQATGGWSQRRFQQRADERIMALGRQISEEANGYLKEHGVEMLVVAGDDLITGVLDRTMPDDLKDLIIATIRLDIQATTEEIVDATLPLAEQAEAARERISVETVVDMAQSGGAAVTGSHLVINEDFHEDGWVDFVQQRYGAGENRDVFAGATDKFEAVPIIVEEEMVRLAIRSGAEIDVIHTAVPMKDEDPNRTLPEAGEIPRAPAAEILDKFGGVGAVLRY